MPNNRRNARQAQAELLAAENREKAIDLKRAGASYREIGRALGINHETARGYVIDALNERAAAAVASTEQLRVEENERLDAMQAALWTKRGDPKYATALIRISQRRAAINGLNAPKEVSVSGDLAGQVDLSKLSAAQVEQLDALLAAAGVR